MKESNIDILKELQQIFPRKEFRENDVDILDQCIDGLYDKDDFIHACKMLFRTTKSKTIKAFEHKDIFIKYRNMNKENYPGWMDDLSQQDRFDIKENYQVIIGYCFGEWNQQYNCDYPDILELIYSYHKEYALPFWVISGYIQETIDNYYRFRKKYELIEIMDQGKDFVEGCRKILKRVQEFKKKLGNKSLFESVGTDINKN